MCKVATASTRYAILQVRRCIAMIAFVGWSVTINLAGKMTGTAFTVLLLLAFAAGQIIQEAADKLVKTFRGRRFFKQARDHYWKSPVSAKVRKKITAESGTQIDAVDEAFDYCLTRIGDRFAKRDVFLAISDLARSLWLLSILGLVPVVRAAIGLSDVRTRIYSMSEGVIIVIVLSYLAWVRMLRFRELSELPVFSSFLALDIGSGADKTQNDACVEINLP
jgi:hypothetical protein